MKIGISVGGRINEVEKLSHTTDIEKTYWQKIGANFVNTLEDVGYFFADLFAWLIAAIPVLVVLGLIAVVVLVIVKVSIKKSKIRKEKKLKDSKIQTMKYTKAVEVESV